MSLISKSVRGALASLLFYAPFAAAMSGSAAGNYTKSFEPGDPYLNFSLSLIEKLNSNWSLGLSQDVTKNLIIDSENEEWVASDTRVGLTYTFFPNKDEWTLSISGSLTLPVSRTSQHNDVYSKPRLAASLSYPSQQGWMIYASAYIRDTISAYETAPASQGEGGQVLEDYAYNVSQGAAVSRFGFTLGYDISYVETIYHKQERSETEQLDYRNNLPSQGYDFSLYLARDLWQGAELSLQYSQGSALTQTGYEDYVIYDSATSTYGIGFSQAF